MSTGKLKETQNIAANVLGFATVGEFIFVARRRKAQ